MPTQFISASGSAITKPFTCKASYGFTLLEILVALAISGIILTGILYVFDTSNKSYIIQEDVARMQQNVRIAKYYIEKDLRMAGYGIRGMAFDGSLIDAIFFENNLADDDPDNRLPGTDSITITYMDDDASGCGTGGTLIACDALPQLLLKAQMPAGSAEADIQEDLGVSPFSDWRFGCSCNGIDYDSFGYPAIITSPDGSQSDLVFITQAQDTGGGTEDKVQNHPYNGFENKVLNTYPTNSTINFFNPNSLLGIRYFVDTENYLRREKNGTAFKVAENIEDIQVAFYGDYNNDDTVNITDTGDRYKEVNLVSGVMSSADKAKIRYARVTIVGRTAREHNGIASKRPTVEDHAGATQPDYYSRRVLSFTVKIRNLDL
ncbi:prepilin-type N-terminal cleavage/methylation domain-containing protein [Desulfobacter vibrioformis]|uniref:prepilin-type N-terminal cleavage/methylation domain-containing protein n=1 Tax=Desulfobacter vibrioformis TaxID=34031 RepID=UPI00054F15FB|nr:prepilin-type N-terminal cleavage/methylation domain-containing protein [Desulfobacter vibrioformis]